MLKNDAIVPIAFLAMLLGMLFGFLLGMGYNDNKVLDYEKDIQLKCIYENRMQFHSELYSCQWLKGVEKK